MPSWNDDEKTLVEMFSYMRPAGSQSETEFVARYLTPLGFGRDDFDNLVLTLGDAPRVLFSSHMDTVHRRSGRQRLTYDGQHLALSKKAKAAGSSCLGGDDTAGIWLMVEMVKAGVEGVYVIHHAEEQGCVGSSALAESNPAFFEGIDCAVAFDRAGTGDVITHQMGFRTCSDEFALALSKALGGDYRPDDGGAYTDTSEYRGLIPECTNISVGYYHQHSQRERQDIPFLIALKQSLLTVDWAALPVKREPDWWDDGRHHDFVRGRMRDEVSQPLCLTDLCRDYPEIAASVLYGCGIRADEFLQEVEANYGDLAPAGFGRELLEA